MKKDPSGKITEKNSVAESFCVYGTAFWIPIKQKLFKLESDNKTAKPEGDARAGKSSLSFWI